MPHSIVTLIVAVLSLCSLVAAPAFAVGTDDGSTAAADVSAYDEAKAAVDAGDYATALPMLASLTSADPQNANAWNLLGYSHRKLGQLEDAAQAYAVALEINPDHLGALEYQGEMFVETGQLELAKANLARLKAICGSCEEYGDLAEAVEGAGS
jgi:Flp pilus assembly protein TadD